MSQRPPNSDWIELQQLAPEGRVARVILRHSQVIRVQKGRPGNRAGCVVRVSIGSGFRSHALMIVESYEDVAGLLCFVTSAEDWIEVTAAPSFLLTLVRISNILRLDECAPSTFAPAASALVCDEPRISSPVYVLYLSDPYASVAARLRGRPIEGNTAAEGTIDGPVAQNAR